MTKQTWAAVAAALCFALCVTVIAVWPVPFVVRSAGQSTDLYARVGSQGSTAVSVAGADTAGLSGQLLLPSVTVTRPDAHVSLLEALYAYWAPDHEVLRRSAVFPAGGTDASVAAEARTATETSRMNAVAAALKLAKRPVNSLPLVESVSEMGPSFGKLQANDIVTWVDSTTVRTAAEVLQAIAAHEVGDEVKFTVVRDGKSQDVSVVTVAHKSDPDLPVVGAAFGLGYQYDTKVSFTQDPEHSEPAAGLAVSLAVYDQLVADPVIGDRRVAALGTIDGEGNVGPLPGVREGIVSAVDADASILLIPRDHCADLAGLNTTGTHLVPVSTLEEATTALKALSDPAQASSVKGCS